MKIYTALIGRKTSTVNLGGFSNYGRFSKSTAGNSINIVYIHTGRHSHMNTENFT